MNRLWYGGDYNPEQWPRELWDDDVRLMRRAGVTVATVAVFSWARIEPADGEFHLEWLDDVLDRLHAGGIRVDHILGLFRLFWIPRMGTPAEGARSARRSTKLPPSE